MLGLRRLPEFSLWRAVFLSDVPDDTERRSAERNKFLVSLIADNIVLYQTDKHSRNRSFRYYLENAEFRLESLLSLDEAIISLLRKAAESEKERWFNAHTALDSAIGTFREAVNDAPDVRHR